MHLKALCISNAKAASWQFQTSKASSCSLASNW